MLILFQQKCLYLILNLLIRQTCYLYTFLAKRMTTLFNSVDEDLKSFLDTLSPEDIQDKVYSDTYYKGKQYYDWELVRDVKYSFDKSRLSAIVEGSLDYNVNLLLQEGSVWANCSCPIDGMCKHITAVLLFTVQKSNGIEVGENRGKGSSAYKHLLALSKEELVSLLLEFAPEEFLLQIHNRHASEAEALKIFNKAEAAIHKLFENSELLYSPRDFSEALEKQISRIAGLEHQLRDRLSELIFYIIQEIESAIDKGYLYDEYNDTTFELPQAFSLLVDQHIVALPFDSKIKFLTHLDKVLNESVYGIFENLAGLSQESFQEDELHALKKLLLNEYENLSPPLTEEFYELVRPLLSEGDIEKILLHLKEEDSRWLLELADLYQIQGRQSDAIEVIRTSIAKDSKMYGEEQVYLLYLDLLAAQGLELKAASEEAMNCCASSSILEKIEALSKEDIAIYERMLEEKNPQGLLEYYEKKERFADALSLLKRNDIIWDHLHYAFFKKHKKDFPLDAVNYFSDVIDKNLQYTGNNHYHTIAEAIKQIRQVNEQKAKSIAADIRANYNRRRNLMNLLAEI